MMTDDTIPRFDVSENDHSRWEVAASLALNALIWPSLGFHSYVWLAA